MMIAPWHQQIWAQLTRARDRHAHAWLFSGAAGIGKRQLALAFARHLLARADTFDAGVHPDFHALIPEEQIDSEGELVQRYGARYWVSAKGRKPKAVIAVDQVRLLNDAVTTYAHGDGNKVVWLAPAEKMNINAANALLKVLEEPPSATIFLLVSDRRHLLPATVVSRCARIDLSPPDRQQGYDWLAPKLAPGQDPTLLLHLSGGAPMQALALAEGGFLQARQQYLDDIQKLSGALVDVSAAAGRWKKLGIVDGLRLLQRLLVDIGRVSFGANPGHLFNPDQIEWLQRTAKGINLSQVFRLIDDIGRSLQDQDGPLDQVLALEDTLIEFSQLK